MRETICHTLPLLWEPFESFLFIFLIYARCTALHLYLDQWTIMVHGQASGLGLSLQFGSTKLKQQPSQERIGTHPKSKIFDTEKD